METKRKEVGAFRYIDNELEAKIDAAKGWINETNSEARRKAFQHMANLIAQRSPEYVRELEAQIFGHYV